MSTTVQAREDLVVNDPNKGWTTVPVHGNSKRMCQIRRDRQPCGERATLVTTTTKAGKRARYTERGLLPIYTCDDRRHVANAHKQITEING